MDHAEPSTSAPQPSSLECRLPKDLVKDTLEANKVLQRILIQRAEQLEAKLKEADELINAATIEEGQDEPESEISIPGAKKAIGPLPSAEFLNPVSPFYEEALRRSNYISNTNYHPLKPKDVEVLSSAIQQENERLQALKRLNSEDARTVPEEPIDLQTNLNGLDWTRIAEKVSDASSVKRTAIECKVVWMADKHPMVNHAEWSEDEQSKLNALVSQYTKDKKAVDWVKVAEQLGTHRTPMDCMRHGVPRHRHSWSPEADQKLLQAVESYGYDNWQLVARKVSENVSAGQCQNRWQKSLNPMLRKGAWTQEEDERLRKAVAGYGTSWIQVATAILGRTNDQCRERWTEHVNNVSANAVWTTEEDTKLMELVKERGNQWKTICVDIGNNKTGQSCRMRYDRLKRLEKATQSNSSSLLSNTFINPGPSHSIQFHSAPQDTPMLSPSANMHEFSSHPDGDSSTIITPQVKPRAKRKRKEKAASPTNPLAASTASQQGDDQGGSSSMVGVDDGTIPTSNVPETTLATTESAPSATNPKDVSKAKPRPRPKPRGKAKVIGPLLEPSASEKQIDLNATPPSPEIRPAEIMLNPRPNAGGKTSTRPKRKAVDAPVVSELPKSKRTKTARSANPKPSLPSSNVEASNVTTHDGNLPLSVHPKSGRTRKPSGVVANTEQAVQSTPHDSSGDVNEEGPAKRPRRQSSRLLVSSLPHS